MGQDRRLRIDQVFIDLEADPERELIAAAARRLGTTAAAIRELTPVRRAFDARQRRPRFVYTVDATVDGSARLRNAERFAAPPAPFALPEHRVRRQERIVIVGAGPAGLFAALTLARAGLKPILLDRGRVVERRAKDVGALVNRGLLDEDSNICYGEGGAGTWSDGKLVTRIGSAEVRSVLETLHAFGAPDRILLDAKPHLGTDKLVKIIRRFREVLLSHEAELRFETRAEELVLRDGAVRGVRTQHGETIDCDRLLLAVGHSARALYRSLLTQGVALEAKPFAVGYRVEHPQALINEIQYKGFATHPRVPTADYRLTAQVGEGEAGRGVYSFCMCPGGVIMPTATRSDEVVVNGMSNASRSGRWANAALVVTVSPRDFAGDGDAVLAGADFQRAAEQRAFTLGGGGFRAPAQRVTDFLARRPSPELRKTTYGPGVAPARLDLGSDEGGIFSASIIEALQGGLRAFERRMRGFISDDAVLHAVETRTSAPVRLPRGEDFQSVNVRGLYPLGEGAGYAGGIVSAAVDGIRAADRIARELSE